MNDTRLARLLKAKHLRFIDLARKLGVDKSLVTRWAQKEIPPNRLIDVERETGIPRAELRPDLFSEAPQ